MPAVVELNAICYPLYGLSANVPDFRIGWLRLH